MTTNGNQHKDQLMPRPTPPTLPARDYRHGKPAGYRAGCRCAPCGAAWSRKGKLYTLRAHAAGGSTTVAVDDVRADLEALAARMSRGAVAAVIGSSGGAGYVGRLLSGRINRIGVHRAAAIRAAAAAAATPRGRLWVSAVPTARRLQALTAIGYSFGRLSEPDLMGIHRTSLAKITEGRVTEIRADTHATVRDVYERVSMTFPTASNKQELSGITRAKHRAAAAGWAPPLAWDDIDDLSEEPKGRNFRRDRVRVLDDVAVERILGGEFHLPAVRPVRVEVVRRWRATGRSLNELEQRTGWGRITRYLDKPTGPTEPAADVA